MINAVDVFIAVPVLLYAFLFLRYRNKTFVLCYHKVDFYKSGYRGIVVEPEKFLKQLKYLRGRGYGTIPLAELCVLLRDKKALPKKTFAITFDDGYDNFHRFARPALNKFGFRATVFLSAGFIGKVYQYPHQPEEKHLDAGQINEMLPETDFGAHTVNHPDLTALPLETAAGEIVQSKRIIEEIIKKPVIAFCYPYGKYNGRVKDIVRENGFICACTTEFGLTGAGSDVFAIPRFEFKEWAHMSARDFFRNFDFYLKTFLGL